MKRTKRTRQPKMRPAKPLKKFIYKIDVKLNKKRLEMDIHPQNQLWACPHILLRSDHEIQYVEDYYEPCDILVIVKRINNFSVTIFAHNEMQAKSYMAGILQMNDVDYRFLAPDDDGVEIDETWTGHDEEVDRYNRILKKRRTTFDDMPTIDYVDSDPEDVVEESWVEP